MERNAMITREARIKALRTLLPTSRRVRRLFANAGWPQELSVTIITRDRLIDEMLDVGICPIIKESLSRPGYESVEFYANPNICIVSNKRWTWPESE